MCYFVVNVYEFLFIICVLEWWRMGDFIYLFGVIESKYVCVFIFLDVVFC